MSRLTFEDLTPDDLPRRPDLDHASDSYMDANPGRGETEADRAEWERIKRQFAEKWIPLTNMRVRQAS